MKPCRNMRDGKAGSATNGNSPCPFRISAWAQDISEASNAWFATMRPSRSRLQWVHEDGLEDGGIQDHFFGLECRGRAGELHDVFVLPDGQQPRGDIHLDALVHGEVRPDEGVPRPTELDPYRTDDVPGPRVVVVPVCRAPAGAPELSDDGHPVGDSVLGVVADDGDRQVPFVVFTSDHDVLGVVAEQRRPFFDPAWIVHNADVLCEQVQDRKSTRLNSSHVAISYAVF